MPSEATDRLSISAQLGDSIWHQFLRAATFACVLAAGAMCLPVPAHAWGCEGHQVIALLAEKHLTPRALAMAQKILADWPIDPGLSRYCKQGGNDAMADGSTWADDIRGMRPETSPWHYLDISRGTTRLEVEKHCDPKEGCVTRALRDQLSVLRAAAPGPQERADALRFLIHFAGDLHQPMHAITNNDQGGNCVPVAFFDSLPQVRNPAAETYAPNLHGVWDTNILERASSGKSVDQTAMEIDQSLRRKIARWQKGSADVDAWAWESYQLAGKKAYGKLPVPIGFEAPQVVKSCADDNHVSERMLELNERLTEAYQNMAAPIVRQRLAQAGARLALLLNDLWP
jgi:S1/P1 Nuclease